LYNTISIRLTVLQGSRDNELCAQTEPRDIDKFIDNLQYGGGVIYYLLGGYDYPILMFWINLLNACLWIVTAPFIFNSEKISKLVAFLSAISFEIYLVHHPFCLGAYSLVQYMPMWLAIICVFAIAIAGGWLLSVITSALLSIQQFILSKNKGFNENI